MKALAALVTLFNKRYDINFRTAGGINDIAKSIFIVGNGYETSVLLPDDLDTNKLENAIKTAIKQINAQILTDQNTIREKHLTDMNKELDEFSKEHEMI